jgi:PAS domain S-box-containing protein
MIFAIDTWVDLDAAIAVMYVAVVLLAATVLEWRGVLLVAVGCVCMTVVSFVLQHGISERGDPFLRCLVSLAAIGITTVLEVRTLTASRVQRERERLLDLTHDTVFARDMNGVITYWNRGAEELYGWPREEAVGKVTHQLLQTVFATPLQEIIARLIQSGRWEGELVHTKRDGAPVIVASRWSLQRDEGGRPVAILETNTDVTDRKHADDELRKSERRYRNIFEMAGVAILEEDFSQVMAQLDALRAQGVRDFRRYLTEHPEIVRQTLATVTVTDANDAAATLFGAKSKEELLAAIPILSTPEVEAAWVAQLPAIAEGRRTVEWEVVLTTLRNETISTLVTIVLPPEASGFDSVLVTVIDLTERNRAQEALHQAQAALAHVTRVTTLGELTASLSHEVNQPLAAIVTNAEACLRWLDRAEPQLEQAKAAAQRIIRDGKRASDVVSRLRALSKRTGLQMLPLDVNDVIEEAVSLVQREVQSHRVSLGLELAPSLPAVVGDRVQLHQVLINLLMNGIQAIEPVTDRPRELVVRTERDASDGVRIEVQDSGIGIDPEHMDHLFDAFFTTKPDGMGMGLSICRSIIEAHGGRVGVSRNVGPGTTFQLRLPAIQSAPYTSV